MRFLRQAWAITTKDLATELRTWEMLSAMLVFAVLALLIFSFALDLRGATARVAAPGVLWSVVLFAGSLGFSRSMVREQQTGCIDGLLLAPMDRTAIFLGKLLGNLALMLVVEVVLLPLTAALLNVPLWRSEVVLIMLLGTMGYAAAGTLMAAIAVNTRAREVLLPILLLPLAVPLLIGAVQATGAALEGWLLAEGAAWLRLVVVYDLVVTALALVTFNYLVEE